MTTIFLVGIAASLPIEGYSTVFISLMVSASLLITFANTNPYINYPDDVLAQVAQIAICTTLCVGLVTLSSGDNGSGGKSRSTRSRGSAGGNEENLDDGIVDDPYFEVILFVTTMGTTATLVGVALYELAEIAMPDKLDTLLLFMADAKKALGKGLQLGRMERLCFPESSNVQTSELHDSGVELAQVALSHHPASENGPDLDGFVDADLACTNTPDSTSSGDEHVDDGSSSSIRDLSTSMRASLDDLYSNPSAYSFRV